MAETRIRRAVENWKSFAAKIPVRPSRATLAEVSSQLSLARCLSEPGRRGSVYLLECDNAYYAER